MVSYFRNMGVWCVGWSYLYLAGGIGGRWVVFKKMIIMSNNGITLKQRAGGKYQQFD